ncbi:hypothetical protein RRG08_031737 [Elysia crispata]|uniref:Uncharacterized protein n=1 Tax=Elysia crispata TaxID=231223 RepID=A0AAE0ZF60_9GAST|nr:hypothetical protein RRG08_031737 [Elysia crispata]
MITTTSALLSFKVLLLIFYKDNQEENDAVSLSLHRFCLKKSPAILNVRGTASLNTSFRSATPSNEAPYEQTTLK